MTRLQYNYEQYKMDCEYLNSLRPGDFFRPSVLDFLKEVLVDKIEDFYMYNIAPIVCKYKGHDWKTESYGDAESGPITYHYCDRCGHGEKPIFGM